MSVNNNDKVAANLNTNNTVVNSNVAMNQNISQNTVINSDITKSTSINNIASNTMINPNIIENSSEIKIGTIVNDKYEIIESLNICTGEADLYICKCCGEKYVIKIYRRHCAIKPEVINILRAIDSPYIAKLIDVGLYNDLPFEVLPYYENGNLQNKKFSLEELKKYIIPCINEALNILHKNKIIHKDLKPSNIMLLDDNKGVAIIDFGISSVVSDENTVLVTKTGMTPEYSAPETFKNLFLEESDYYSFGITIYELFCGYTPYQNMNPEEIARFTTVQKIPFPESMPRELRNLISGVTYFDITNRDEKNNPNRRWTYKEVLNWCAGKEQVVPGEGMGVFSKNNIPLYKFLGNDYNDISSLVDALAINWNDGKKQLYRGLLSSYFKSFNSEIASICTNGEEEASKYSGRDDIIFWNVLYKICPNLDNFYWKGKRYESLPALGRDMLEKLWQGNNLDCKYWDSILENKLLTSYLNMIQTDNKNLRESASALESSHQLKNLSNHNKKMNYYTMAYLLSGQRILNIENKRIKDIYELNKYMRELLDCSYSKFEKFCHKMVDYNGVLDVQLESWLIAIGKRKEINSWRENLK